MNENWIKLLQWNVFYCPQPKRIKSEMHQMTSVDRASPERKICHGIYSIRQIFSCMSTKKREG